MISLVTLFGLLGNITTGLVYLAPVKTFWHIVQRRSTEEFESLPYVVKLLNGYLWLYYGIIKPNSVLVATVNGFGAFLELIYVIIFLLFAPPRMKAITAILFVALDIVFPVAAALVIQLLLKNTELQIDVVGFLCLIFSIATYGSPLSIMKTVVTTKSVEYMPFLLSFILFINGATWTVYAALTKDWFIGIPNGSGLALGTAQLVLYAIYWKPKKEKKVLENVEAGWQHEPLIAESGPLQAKE